MAVKREGTFALVVKGSTKAPIFLPNALMPKGLKGKAKYAFSPGSFFLSAAKT